MARHPWDHQAVQAKAFLRDGKRAAPPPDRGIHATAWANGLGADLDVIDSICTLMQHKYDCACGVLSMSLIFDTSDDQVSKVLPVSHQERMNASKGRLAASEERMKAGKIRLAVSLERIRATEERLRQSEELLRRDARLWPISCPI
jgi:hypothetical protein